MITRKQAQKLLDERLPVLGSIDVAEFLRTILALYDAVDKLGETSRRLQQALDLSERPTKESACSGRPAPQEQSPE